MLPIVSLVETVDVIMATRCCPILPAVALIQSTFGLMISLFDLSIYFLTNVPAKME